MWPVIGTKYSKKKNFRKTIDVGTYIKKSEKKAAMPGVLRVRYNFSLFKLLPVLTESHRQIKV